MDNWRLLTLSPRVYPLAQRSTSHPCSLRELVSGRPRSFTGPNGGLHLPSQLFRVLGFQSSSLPSLDPSIPRTPTALSTHPSTVTRSLVCFIQESALCLREASLLILLSSTDTFLSSIATSRIIPKLSSEVQQSYHSVPYRNQFMPFYLLLSPPLCE